MSGDPITIEGHLQSVSKHGQKAQIVVKTGAYRGTYHAEYVRTIDIDGVDGLIQEWLTKPNPKTGEQFKIITGVPM